MKVRHGWALVAVSAMLLSGCGTTGTGGGGGSGGGTPPPTGGGGTPPPTGGGGGTPPPAGGGGGNQPLSFLQSSALGVSVDGNDNLTTGRFGGSWSLDRTGPDSGDLVIVVDGVEYRMDDAIAGYSTQVSGIEGVIGVDPDAGHVAAGWYSQHAGALLLTTVLDESQNASDPFLWYVINGNPTDPANIPQLANYEGMWQLSSAEIAGMQGKFLGHFNFGDNDWTLVLSDYADEHILGSAEGTFEGAELSGTMITFDPSEFTPGAPEGFVSENTVAGHLYGPEANSVAGLFYGETDTGAATHGHFLGVQW